MNDQNSDNNFEADQKNHFLKELKKHKSICWYPSAGSDFRPLLYLSKPFYQKHEELAGEDVVFPDLFVMTDYHMYQYEEFSIKRPYVIPHTHIVCQPRAKYHVKENFDKIRKGTLTREDILYDDGYTILTVKTLRKLFINDIDAYQELITESIPSCYGQCYLMTVEIDSHQSVTNKLGTWEMDVIYLYAENTAFVKKVLLQNRINIDYIVRVRYGGRGSGGRETRGIWLLYLADLLNVKYYISDSFCIDQVCIDYDSEEVDDHEGDKKALKYLKGDSGISFKKPQVTSLYFREWYKGQPVEWYRVER